MAKIAIVSIMANNPWGASEYLWALMAEQALAEGHEVFLSIFDWSTSHPSIIKLKKLGACLIPRPKFPSLPSRASRRLFRDIPTLKSLAPKSWFQPVIDCKPDVIFINEGNRFDTLCYPDFVELVQASSIPYIILCHSNSDSSVLDAQLRNEISEFFSKAAKIGFVSQQSLKLAERQLAQFLPNATVVQNPVNLTDTSLVPFPTQSKLSFASVARLDVTFKGHDVLFETLSSSIWKERDWQCCLYGSGPDEDYLRQLARHYDIYDRIKFMGHVSDIRSIWADNHFMVLPSRAEGGPIALIEAMLCGRAAVVTNVGIVSEWVEEGRNGFIAEAATAKSFGNALERAWSVQSNLQDMGVQAHEMATNKFDSKPGKTLLKLLLNAVN
ncbi:MAG: glycosyltransferase family 4 protein [Calothrix sp. C42_A2020_038]|nr:glycosyltransferase family 4 protein [Calothrix sp. C42_A2020_038]